MYAPGNPLTEFPPEIRSFLKQGLLITYSINIVLAIQAFFIAKNKNLPVLFWFMKTFLLGGIAFFEINEAKDPNDYGNENSKKDKVESISNRRSLRNSNRK